MLRRTVGDEEIGQTLEHVVGSEPSGNNDRQAAARELVEHDQHAEGAAVPCAVLDEVAGPDVVRTLRSETDARSIIEPQTAPFGLFAWYFQPFPAPDAIDAFDVDPPAFGNQHLADAPIAVAAVPGCQPHNGSRQSRFVVRRLQMSPLRRTWLSDDRTRATLRDIQLRTHVLDARPLPGRA